MKPMIVIAMSSISRRDKEAHQFPTASAADWTAPVTAAIAAKGFQKKSPVGSTLPA
jgi:hypothetical protein